MKTEKTDNELIAEFMGINFADKEAYLRYSPPICKRFGLYDRSWDWLMPVVEKIEAIDNGSFGFTTDPWGMVITEYQSGNEHEIVSFQNDDDYPKIQQYYQCVIQFIKWYNSQSPKPTEP